MIWLYSGTPGAGKSLHMARIIMTQLQRGKPCICNFPIDQNRIRGKNKGEFVECNNLTLTPDYLINYADKVREKRKGKVKEGTILLCIDECQILFNSREWNQKNRAAWLSFFTQHRKFGYDIILVAQFDRMIDRQIRALIEYEYIHRKISNYGAIGKMLSMFAFGQLFVCVKIWYPMGEKVGSEFFTARKKYYRLYDTFMMFDAPG